MLGAIIGDIIGSIYEYNNIKTKEFDLFKKECFPTDDSIMTIAVAKSFTDMLKNKSKLKDLVIDNMVTIGRKYEDCGYGGTFYMWIMTNNHQPYGSFGNGAAMRVSACAYAAKTLEEAKKYSKIVTDVSHNHQESEKGAEAITVAIYMALHGYSLKQIEKEIKTNYYKIDFTLEDLRKFYTYDVTCQGTVPQALEAFFESTSYEDAIRNAISIGGDSDTIAAITGGIAEAYWGIPDDIKLKGFTYLDSSLQNIVINFYKEFKNNH